MLKKTRPIAAPEAPAMPPETPGSFFVEARSTMSWRISLSRPGAIDCDDVLLVDDLARAEVEGEPEVGLGALGRRPAAAR